jgi:hypothetical protein
VPCEDNEAIYVLSVPKVAASKEYLVHTYWRHNISDIYCAFKAVKLVVRILALNIGSFEYLKHLLVSVEAEVKKLLDALLVFQVGLSIEVFSLDVAKALRDGAVEQYQVSREVLIPAYLDDHAYVEFLPLQLFEGA